MQRMITIALLLWAVMAGLNVQGQVINGSYRVQVIGYQFKSDADGDGYGFPHYPWDDSDNDNEENVCHVWIENGGSSTPQYCHVWHRKNYEPSESHKAQSDYPNITIAALPVTQDPVINVRATYWENDKGDDCTFDNGSLPPPFDYDDYYTPNASAGSFNFVAQPQSEWFFHPLTSFPLTYTNQTPSSARTWIGVKTYWNYTYGDSFFSPLHFGNIQHTTPERTHINRTDFADPEGHLAPDFVYTNEARESSPDVYYKFTLNEKSLVDISTIHAETNFDTKIWLFSNDGVLLASNDDHSGTLQSRINQELCAGDYIFIVEGYGPNKGKFKVSVKADPVYTYTDSTWVVTTFIGGDLSLNNTYETGHFIVNKMAIDSDDFYDGVSDYNTIPGFQGDGCKSTGNDHFIHVYKTRLPSINSCYRMYNLTLEEVNDEAEVYVDGQLVWSSVTAGCTTDCGVVWSGEANTYSGKILEVRHREITGQSKIAFSGGDGVDGGWRIEFFDGDAVNYSNLTNWQHIPGYITYGGEAVPYLRRPYPNETHIYHIQDAWTVQNPSDLNRCPPYNSYDNDPDAFIYVKEGFEPGFYTMQARAGTIRYPTLFVNGQRMGNSSSTSTNYRYEDYYQAPYNNMPINNSQYNSWSHAHNIGGNSPFFLDEDDLVQFFGVAGHGTHEYGLTIIKTETPNLLYITAHNTVQSPCDPNPSTTINAYLSGFSDPKVSLQWQQSDDGGSTWNDISGATALSYVPALLNQTTQFRAALIHTSGEKVAHSAPVTINITNTPNPNPLTGGQVPAYNELLPCTQTTLSVSGLSGIQSGLTYQWQASPDSTNWSNLPNTNASTLTATNLGYDQHYRCIVTNVCGEATTTTPGLVKSINDNPPSSSGWSIGIRQNGQFIGKGQDPTLSISNLDGNSLAVVPNYTGCVAPPDNYQVTYRRTGWPCDDYRFQLANFTANPSTTNSPADIHLRIDEDGDGNWDYTATNSVGFGFNYLSSPFLYLTLNGAPFDHTATLTNASIVEIEVTEPTTDPYFPNNGLIVGKSLNVQVTPQGNTSTLTAGTATGDESLYPCTLPSPITVTGTSASTALTYQWQASTDGGNNWSNIAGATAANYSPAALAQTTAFRRMTVDGCGNVAPTHAAVKTVNALPTEGIAGHGVWNAYAYTGQNFDTYTGRFTLPHTGFNLTNEAMNADVNGNPSVASTYAGCPLPNDYWSTRLLRTGWACGDYRFDFTDWDDNLTLKVDRDGDGTFEFSQSLNCCVSGGSTWWDLSLNPNSVVAIDFQEVAGMAFLNLTVYPIGSGLTAGTAAGHETADRCAPLSAITVTGEAAASTVTYQWQASTDGGTNWSDITGATAATYTPQPLNATTAFRRKATDACSNTAFTNAVTKTINPLPAEGVAGNGVWNAYAYTGQNFDTYTGRFTLPHTGFNLTNEAMNADVNGNPSVASTYVGCPLPNDYWSTRLLRTGWACGDYRFDFTDWDDNLTLKVDRDGDGAFEFSQSLNCCVSGGSTWWDLSLNPNSVVAIDFQEVAGMAFLNLTVYPIGSGLTAGTAAGHETADRCAPLSAITVTGEAATTAVTYQWQVSTDGGNNWSDITGATAATYTPQPLNATTAFRRKATDACSNTAFTNAVTKAINPLPTEGVAGNGVWNGYAYTGQNFDTYEGFYALPTTGLNLAQAMNNDVFASPSAIAGYIGCPIPVDNFSTRLVRTGWDCGYYDFHLTDADDEIFVYIDTDGDGTPEASFTKFWSPTPPDEHHYFYLNPASRVTVTVMEGSGGANIALGITKLNSGLSISNTAGTQTLFACEAPTAVSVSGITASSTVTYQWQSSPDGTTWTDVPEADAPTYSPAALSATTHFRCRITDTCSQVAFSSPITKTVSPLPTEGQAGSGAWYGYAYEGEWGAYRGRFTAASTDIQLSSIGLSANAANAQPADIGTYVGCATDHEAFSVRLLRRHWTPAHYTFALADIDGNAQIAIDTDGDGNWEYLSPSLDAPSSSLWAGALDSNAVVRIEYKDQAGVSRLHVTASSVALPVELIHFEASIDEDRKTRLHWATATELNNEGFEIERSTDGVTWEVIGWMPGQGTTQERTDYFHWDEAPHDGVNYYRLHQRDYDGAGAHSPIRSVQYDHSPKGQKPIAFPNPVTDGTLTLLHAQGRVTLRSSLGQVLQTWRIDTDEARIDLSRYAPGAYWLSVHAPDGQVTTLRIIK